MLDKVFGLYYGVAAGTEPEAPGVLDVSPSITYSGGHTVSCTNLALTMDVVLDQVVRGTGSVTIDGNTYTAQEVLDAIG